MVRGDNPAALRPMSRAGDRDVRHPDDLGAGQLSDDLLGERRTGQLGVRQQLVGLQLGDTHSLRLRQRPQWHEVTKVTDRALHDRPRFFADSPTPYSRRRRSMYCSTRATASSGRSVAVRRYTSTFGAPLASGYSARA